MPVAPPSSGRWDSSPAWRSQMSEQEQAYSAAARYIQVINDLTTELMNLV